MSLEIKICGLKTAQNIQELNNLNPDYMGFIQYEKSARYVGADFSFQKLAHCKTVAVTVNESYEQLSYYAQHYDYIQLHGEESVEICQSLVSQTKFIKAVGIDEFFDFSVLQDYEPYIDFFIFDTKSPQYGGNGQQYDWAILEKYQGEKGFFLSGGIGATDVLRIKKIQHPKLIGLDLNSRFEMSPGIKNIELLRKFIKEIKN